MKDLKWKIFWCLFPVALSLLVTGVAWYNYNNPPLQIGGLTLSRLKFKLGVDLVGGTILVYEIDKSKPQADEAKPEQLVSALKKRLDPADLYNITIRHLPPNRVEIILPTGGRHQIEAQKKAWEELLNAAAEQFKVDPEKLKARPNRTAELAQEIKHENPSASDEDIAKLIASKWSQSDQALTGDDVQRLKDLISQVGSLEFRILANRKDDGAAIDKAKEYFEKAASSWREFVGQVRSRYAEIEKPGKDDDKQTYKDIAFGDLNELKGLVKKRYPSEQPGDIDAWFRGNFKPNDELRDMLARADSGAPPPAPYRQGEGSKFTITLPDGEHRISYSWVELGKSELHSLRLNTGAIEDAIERAIEKNRARDRASAENDPEVQDVRRLHDRIAMARAAGTIIDGTQVRLIDGTQEILLPVAGSGEFATALYVRKITNRNRVSEKDWADGKRYEYFFLTRDPEPGKAVTGEFLTSASEGADQSGKLAVNFRFNARGAALFHELTSNNAPRDESGGKRHLAIVLDGLIQSAPTLNSPIRESGQITGNFKRSDVSLLVNILRSGALPATLKPTPVSENTMGATLGDDTVRSGTLSVLLAFLTVLAFMVVYYRFAGLVACVALLANLLLTIGFMVAVNATFTLPGLAGLVLMLAMAVDANILIYERLREERERGASLQLALRNGYDRAFPTIIDTHLSSIFTAIVLYVVGNDQLKGFGISLTVGLLISLFTSLFMTKVIFRIWEMKGWLKKLSMAKLLSKPRINFMGIRKPVFVATIATAVIGLALFLARGKSTLNMDFVGGTVYSGVLNEMMSTKELRERIESDEAQKKFLALATDPELVDREKNIWKLTYKEAVGGFRDRLVKMTEDVTVTQMRERAETLPEPTIEMTYVSSGDFSEGNKSKLFTIRTTEKSADLAASSIARLLGDDLQKVSLKGYTIPQVVVSFSKPVTLRQARSVLLPPLQKEGVIGTAKDAKDVAGALDLVGPALSEVWERTAASEGVVLVPREEGATRGTLSSLTLSFKTPVSGEKLWSALAPITEKGSGPDKGTVEILAAEAHLEFDQPTSPSQARSRLKDAFEKLLASGQEVTLREDRESEKENRYTRMAVTLPSPVDGQRFASAMEQFREQISRPTPERLENFDSALAADTQQRAIAAIVASWGAILLYLWFRFGNWTFGLAAVLCLIHDVCMTLGVIAVCHYLHTWFGPVLGIRDFKLDLPAIASLLTLIGFSVNDTIVVFDRIREVRGKNPNLTPEMINDSVNQTLSRTILTSLTAWLVVLVLYIWGGEGIHLFAFVMVVGVVIGTMSSIFVASPLLLILGEGAPRTTAGTPTAPARPRDEMTAPQEG